MKMKGIEDLIERLPGRMSASEELSFTEGYNYAVSVFSALKPDEMASDVSLEDECVFIFFRKENVCIFFNIFPDDMSAVASIIQAGGFSSLEGGIKDTAERVVEKFINIG